MLQHQDIVLPEHDIVYCDLEPVLYRQRMSRCRVRFHRVSSLFQIPSVFFTLVDQTISRRHHTNRLQLTLRRKR